MIQFLNAIALITGMAGSIMIASNTGAGVYGYILFLTSSTTSSALLWKQKDQRGLLFLNIFYIGVNVFGLCRYAGVL